MNLNKKAVVLLSGGMDSTLCLAIAINEGFDVSALHLNYGQKTQNKELDQFHEICNFYNIQKRLVVDVSHFALIGGNSLTDSKIEVSPANLDSELIPSSYVPFRNGNILAIAASWAESTGASSIFIGANQLDSSGYPDCREEFFSSFEKAIFLGTKPETNLKIITPIINYTKKDIVQKSIELNSPLHLTWSCYSSSEKACGKCDSCGLRLRGFEQAGIKDPISYMD